MYFQSICIPYSRKYWRELYLADCAKIVENRNWRIIIWWFSRFGMSHYNARIKIVGFKFGGLLGIHQSAKFNSPAIFPAIRYMEI